MFVTVKLKTTGTPEVVVNSDHVVMMRQRPDIDDAFTMILVDGTNLTILAESAARLQHG